MPGLFYTVCCFIVVLSGLGMSQATGNESASKTQTIPAEQTVDGKAFSFVMTLQSREDRYSIWRLTYPSPAVAGLGNFPDVVARLYLPNDWKEGARPRTGIVCIDVLGGNGVIPALLGNHFASRGFPVFLPVLPCIGERATQQGKISTMLKQQNGIRSLGELFLRVHPELRRGLDLFCSRPEVLSERVHVVGASLGSIIACGFAAKDSRIDKVVLLVGGGNIKKIVELNTSDAKLLAHALDHAPQKDRQFVFQSLEHIEPPAFASQLKQKADAGKILMYNAEHDEIIVPERTAELAKAIGMEKKRKVFPGVGHFTAAAHLPEILPEITAFFLDDTIPASTTDNKSRDSEQNVKETSSANVLLKKSAAQLACLLDSTHVPGKDMSLEAELAVDHPQSDKDNYSFYLVFVKKDKQYRFSLRTKGKTPFGSQYERIAFGQNECPWLAAHDGVVFRGSKHPTEQTVQQFLSTDANNTLKMIRGLLELLQTGDAHVTLDSLLGIRIAKRNGSPPSLSLRKANYRMEIRMNASCDAIEGIAFQDERSGMRVRLLFKRFDKTPDAAACHFECPITSGKPIKETNQAEMKLVLGTLVNTLLEKLREQF